MAVFLLKAEHGSSYVPPACAGIFDDVPCPGPFADWIEQLSAEGITAGCGGDNYCPDNPVRRDQMAVFLLKTEHGSAYVPPTCTGVFDDVTCPGPVHRLDRAALRRRHHGRLLDDSPLLYCPASPINRGADGDVSGEDVLASEQVLISGCVTCSSHANRSLRALALVLARCPAPPRAGQDKKATGEYSATAIDRHRARARAAWPSTSSCRARGVSIEEVLPVEEGPRGRRAECARERDPRERAGPDQARGARVPDRSRHGREDRGRLALPRRDDAPDQVQRIRGRRGSVARLPLRGLRPGIGPASARATGTIYTKAALCRSIRRPRPGHAVRRRPGTLKRRPPHQLETLRRPAPRRCPR